LNKLLKFQFINKDYYAEFLKKCDEKMVLIGKNVLKIISVILLLINI